MGQIFQPSRSDVILTAVDRLVASNADGGLSPASQHVILLGEDAGQNLALSDIVALGEDTMGGAGTGAVDTPDLDGSIAIGGGALSMITNSGNAAIAANVA